MPRPSAASRVRLLRQIDAMAVRDTLGHWSIVPPELARRLRPRVARVGDAVLTLSSASDSLRMNRVIGLGSRGLAREPMIDEIIALYRGARVARFSLLLGPDAGAGPIAGWLARRGFARHGGHALLVRDCARPVPASSAGVSVRRARREHFDAIIAIHERCFAIPVSRRSWSHAALANPDAEPYVAFVGEALVGAGSLRIDGTLAWLGGGATLTRWRRRGAHAALIAARLRRAAHQGCRWAWVETAEPAPGRPQGSYRNLLRMGFEPAGIKPMFVWTER